MKRILSIFAVIAILITMCAAITLPAVAASGKLVNLFDLDTAAKDGEFYTTPYIAVNSGDVLYFGVTDITQDVQLYVYAGADAAGVPMNATYKGGKCVIEETFTMLNTLHTWGIMSYTVPQGCTGVKMVVRETYASQYLLTKNRSFTNAERKAFFNVSVLSENYFKPIETKGYYKTDGSFKTSSTYVSGEILNVKAGDTLYFGPYDTTLRQDYYGILWGGEDGYSDYISLTDTKMQNGSLGSIVATLPNGWIFVSYTAPKDGRLAIFGRATNIDLFYASMNAPITLDNIYDYWDIYSNDIDDYSALIGRYDNTPAPRESVLNGKTALFVGDSLCAAVGDDDYFNDMDEDGWAGRLKMHYGLKKAFNNGVSGAALSNTRDRWYNAASGSTSKQQGRIYWQITSEKGRLYDYVLLEGGGNDAWDVTPLGKISDSFELEDFDLSTFAGGMEATIYQAVKYHPESAIGYMNLFQMPYCKNGKLGNPIEYFELAKEICKKWGIPYLDLYSILTAENFDTTIYTYDNIHANAAGYHIITPLIAEFMETLTPYSDVTKNTDKLVVACAGDSLTKGTDSGDVIRNSYPAFLQEMLGDEYEVYNFGSGGAAAQETVADRSYRNTSHYKNSMLSDPDLVVVMLGANDSAVAWDTADHTASCAAFKQSLKEIVEGYQALPSKPTVYLAAPPYINKAAYRTIYLEGGLLATVEELADEMGLTFIDNYTITDGRTDLLVEDNVHYQPEGYKMIAANIYKGITGQNAPEVLSILDKDTAVAETNKNKPLIRNWKQYYDTADAFRIETVEDVQIFGDLIAAGKTFKGKTVYLENDLDFAGIRFKPLGVSPATEPGEVSYAHSFQGTFDGQFHVFSNVNITEYNYTTMGLFPILYGATIKNFGMDGGLVKGNSVVGAIAAYGDYGTVLENVWSSADVFGATSVAGIVANMRKNSAPNAPKLKNVACYGTVSGNDYVTGLCSWGQTKSLQTENVVFGGTLDLHTKTNNSTPFVRYGSTGITGITSGGSYTTTEAEQKTIYVDDMNPVLFEKEDFSNGAFVYYMSKLEGNDTTWSMQYGYAVPWEGGESADLIRILVNGKNRFINSAGLLPAEILETATYWYGTDGKCYPTATAANWILNDGDSIQVAVSAAGADFDNDGAITTADVVMLLRYIDHRDATLTEAQADVNADGKTIVYDAVWLLQVINNMAE